METRKQKLLAALNLIVTNLSNDTVIYDWDKMATCNCGLVSQAILKIDRKGLNLLINPMRKELRENSDHSGVDVTWKLGVQLFCPITGDSMHDIFNRLAENGLTKEDITHLEYMDNPAILNKAKIKTSKFPYFGSAFGKLFPNKYYKDPKNLIKYLKAWITILHEENSMVDMHATVIDNNKSKLTLESKLLVAVAEEDFETAATLRDLINRN